MSTTCIPGGIESLKAFLSCVGLSLDVFFHPPVTQKLSYTQRVMIRSTSRRESLGDMAPTDDVLSRRYMEDLMERFYSEPSSKEVYLELRRVVDAVQRRKIHLLTADVEDFENMEELQLLMDLEDIAGSRREFVETLVPLKVPDN